MKRKKRVEERPKFPGRREEFAGGAYPADLAGPRHPRPSGAVRVPGGTEGRRRSRQR